MVIFYINLHILLGNVNFYYKDKDGKKQTAVMNTGDSMYITPFVSH